MGGTPSKGTSKDMRLKQNKQASKKPASNNLYAARQAKMASNKKK